MRKSATTLAAEINAEEMRALLSRLRSEKLRGAHLEIGTAAGGTLKEMMLCYPVGARPRFVVVDPMTYFPNQLSIVRQNLASAGIDPNEVEFRVTRSWPAFKAAQRANESYAFMFIDGSHKFNHVTEDLAWTRLLEPGGLVCIHDYEPRFWGVTTAVDRFLARYSNYQMIEQVDRLLFITKTYKSDRREIGLTQLLIARAVGLHYQVRRSIRRRISRSHPAHKSRDVPERHS